MAMRKSNHISKTLAASSPRGLRGDVDEYFAHLGRDGEDEIRSATRLVLAIPFLQDIINAMPVPVSILNEKSQVVLTNRCWDRSVGAEGQCLLGKRHGDLLSCVCRDDGPDGCGTSRRCAGCGAAVSILESQHLCEQVTCEFRLVRETSRGPETSELMVTSTPLQVDGRTFSIFALHDIDPRVSVKTYDV